MLRFGEALSNQCSVLSVVPRGRCFGPVLFFISINDLPQVQHSKIRMFADDAKLYKGVSSPDDVALLQDT